MEVRNTVEELTQICMEIRCNLQSKLSQKEKEKLILGHIKTFANRKHRINDFQKGLEWFNVSEGLSTKQHLAGKIVILDFFTYCCINCMHVLPDLHALEKAFSVKDGLVVIGVHSAKFSNERDSKRLLSAVQRYNITHAVVNDVSLSTWQDLGISCWPSLVMIGPKGEPLAVFVGEGHKEELRLYVDVALNYYKSLNLISSTDLPMQSARHLLPVVKNGSLLFPGKIQVFQIKDGERLAISDTGNNRILVADTTGTAECIIGGNNPGFSDGDFQNARFNAPQGVCTLGSSIFVADTENHAIRKIDLEKRIVTTVAGTGFQGHDYTGGKIGQDQILSSPWDVAVYNYRHDASDVTVPVLLIAIAGTHQIWALFLEDAVWWKNKLYKAGTCRAIVGTGKEENRNNTYPHAAGLAQPSGLAVAEKLKAVFFADSESSTVRRVDLQSGRVSAVCGANRNPADLHDFGDVDGAQYAAKLQHALGVMWHPQEETVYLADTYNHKIKKIDPNTGLCKTAFGDGKPNKGHSFDEPSGLAVSLSGNVLYVADTNNHQVKAIDLRNDSVTTLSLKCFTDEPARSGNSKNAYVFDTTIDAKGGDLSVTFDVAFLENSLKLNADSPQRWSIILPTNTWKAAAKTGELSSPVSVRVAEGNGTTELRVTLDIVACKTTECIPKRLAVVYRVHQKLNAPSVINERKQLSVE